MTSAAPRPRRRNLRRRRGKRKRGEPHLLLPPLALLRTRLHPARKRKPRRPNAVGVIAAAAARAAPLRLLMSSLRRFRVIRIRQRGSRHGHKPSRGRRLQPQPDPRLSWQGRAPRPIALARDLPRRPTCPQPLPLRPTCHPLGCNSTCQHHPIKRKRSPKPLLSLRIPSPRPLLSRRIPQTPSSLPYKHALSN